MTYAEAIAFLYQQLPMYQQVGASAYKKDLTNTRLLLQKLGQPHLRFPTVHVAGTNGKGSSAHSLAAILQSAGYRTGLYTSPHLKSFTERIRIDGTPLAESHVVTFVEQYHLLMQSVRPSFFEMTVAMAFYYFAQQEVDIAIVEVGLGGRLDSTNVINPEVGLITNIGYDHMEMLGDTLAQIAFEKAGIIKPKIPIVIGQKHVETTEVFRQVARERKAPLYFAEEQYTVESIEDVMAKQRVTVRDHQSNQLLTIDLSLRGRYQALNIAGILTTVDRLREQEWKISWANVKAGLANVVALTGLRGRWQVLNRQPLCLADTGHNKEAWEEILEQLRAYKADQYHFVLGVTQGKDIESLLSLLPTDENYYFCQAHVPRAMPAQELAAKAKHLGLQGEVIEDVQQAYEQARQRAKANDVVFVGGSSFVVAELHDL